ncbi:MAG: DNA repair protein RadC [Thermoanaerobaculia bacterium]
MPDTTSITATTTIGDESPLDRLLRAGAESLSDAELVAVLLGSKIEKARTLVCDGLPAFARTEWTARRHRMRPRESARILASLELGRRLSSWSENPRDPVRDPTMLARSLVARYGHHVQERVGAVYLDAKSRVIREREIFVGTLNSTTVSTRDIIRHAIDDHAAGLIVFHNHPSGDPSPSGEDLVFTKQLVDAGKLLGVDVLDHLILGINRFVSLKGIQAM